MCAQAGSDTHVINNNKKKKNNHKFVQEQTCTPHHHYFSLSFSSLYIIFLLQFTNLSIGDLIFLKNTCFSELGSLEIKFIFKPKHFSLRHNCGKFKSNLKVFATPSTYNKVWNCLNLFSSVFHGNTFNYIYKHRQWVSHPLKICRQS